MIDYKENYDEDLDDYRDAKKQQELTNKRWSRIRHAFKGINSFKK